MAVVIKSLSFQIIGEEYPIPATAVFQTTLVTESHRTGKLVSELVPSPFGPRQPGQFCAFVTYNVLISNSNSVQLKNLVFLIYFGLLGFKTKNRTKNREKYLKSGSQLPFTLRSLYTSKLLSNFDNTIKACILFRENS